MKSFSVKKLFLSFGLVTGWFFVCSLVFPTAMGLQQYANWIGEPCGNNGSGGSSGTCQTSCLANNHCTFGAGVCAPNLDCNTPNTGSGSNTSNNTSTTALPATTTNIVPVTDTVMNCGNNGNGLCSNQDLTAHPSSGVWCTGFAGHGSCQSVQAPGTINCTNEKSAGICHVNKDATYCCSVIPFESSSASLQLASPATVHVAYGTPLAMNIAPKILASRVLSVQTILATDVAYYDQTNQQFSNPAFKLSNIPADQYLGILHVFGYLNRQIMNSNGSATLAITQNQATINIPPTALTPGDVAPEPNGDNMIDMQDYNAILGCFNLKATDSPTATCPDPKIADLNHDGIVDQADLDLIQAAFGKKGASFVENVPTYTCVTDPSCLSSTKSMQLCPLKCTKQ